MDASGLSSRHGAEERYKVRRFCRTPKQHKIQISPILTVHGRQTFGTFLPEKWLKKLCLSVEVFLTVEKDPFGVCND